VAERGGWKEALIRGGWVGRDGEGDTKGGEKVQHVKGWSRIRACE
jgi:hypothetical protein